jgi:hypothetical protein
MRRAVLALTAILVIVFLLEPIAQTVEANPLSTHLSIQSPASSRARIYNVTTIDLKISAYSFGYQILEISYSLDGSIKKPLNQTTSDWSDYTVKGTLSNLANGDHSLKAYAIDSHGSTLTSEMTFSVNTSHTYPAFILSPSNISYSEKNIPLELAINSLTVEQRISTNYYQNLTIDYKLDNSSTHSIKGNSTLVGLADGQHKITVTAYNFATSTGLYSEQTTYFTVDTTNSARASPKPTPTIPNSGPTSSPTPTPSVPEFSWLMILPLFISLLFIVVLIRKRKLSVGCD